MKTKKITSIFLSFILVFLLATSNIAANSTSTTPASTRSGDYIYYGIEGGIRKVNLKTKKTSIVKSYSKETKCYNLTLKNGWIYFVEDADIKPVYLSRIRTNGKDYKKLKKIYDDYFNDSYKIYGDKIYYIKSENSAYGEIPLGIYRMNLSGSKDKLIKKVGSISDMTVYKNRIYYTSAAYSHALGKIKYYIESIKLDGSNLKTHLSTTKFNNKLKPYNGYIYYTSDLNKTSRLNLSTNKTSVYISNARLENVKDGYVYCINLDNFHLYKKKISTGKKTLAAHHGLRVYKVQIDGKYLIVYSSGGRDGHYVDLYTNNNKILKLLNRITF